jgi:divalent metal cation (Fe/Co/Zn/Cd) transporter
MPDRPAQTERDTAQDLRAGLVASVVSIVWTLAASAVSITSGLRAGSLVLVAFGCTGFLDATGSVALVVHFRHSLRHESFSERHERVAFLIVNTGLVVVAVSTAVESVLRLVGHAHGDESGLGIAVAGASIAVLAVLSRRKVGLGRAIPSQALVADGILSGTGAILAVVTVLGTLLSTLGWWWADPVAALTVAVGAFAVAVVLARQ